jgi:hypothetical protein
MEWHEKRRDHGSKTKKIFRQNKIHFYYRKEKINSFSKHIHRTINKKESRTFLSNQIEAQQHCKIKQNNSQRYINMIN